MLQGSDGRPLPVYLPYTHARTTNKPKPEGGKSRGNSGLRLVSSDGRRWCPSVSQKVNSLTAILFVPFYFSAPHLFLFFFLQFNLSCVPLFCTIIAFSHPISVLFFSLPFFPLSRTLFSFFLFSLFSLRFAFCCLLHRYSLFFFFFRGGMGNGMGTGGIGLVD